jgi:hypothetical protein
VAKGTSEDVNINLAAYFAKAHISVPLLEILKIPSQRQKIERILGLSKIDEAPTKYTPKILQNMNQGRSNGGHSLFYISLQVNDLLLHNCM